MWVSRPCHAFNWLLFITWHDIKRNGHPISKSVFDFFHTLFCLLTVFLNLMRQVSNISTPYLSRFWLNFNT